MKQPKYFCEHCGSEVGRKAKVCPHCGRFFSSVKCPHCGHVGVADDFLGGCPGCGYAEGMNGNPEPWKTAPPPVEPLPLWTWIAAFGVFAVVLVLILRALR